MAGRHNLLNLQAAAAMAKAAGVSFDAIQEGAKRFGGLPHRCEVVHRHAGITWINDSKATNVGATVAAIEGVSTTDGRIILIAGGDAKGADLSPLAPVLNKRVSQTITLGVDGHKIAKLVQNPIMVNSLQDAVEKAATLAMQHDVVLLSPACASLDMFSNYQERGDQFAKLAKEVAA